MINVGEHYYVIFDDNRPLTGRILEEHSNHLMVLTSDGALHIVNRDFVKEIVSMEGLDDDGDDGGGGFMDPDPDPRFAAYRFVFTEDTDDDDAPE